MEEVLCWEPRRSEGEGSSTQGQGILTWVGTTLMVLQSRFCRVQDGEILAWISCLLLIQCFHPGFPLLRSARVGVGVRGLGKASDLGEPLSGPEMLLVLPQIWNLKLFFQGACGFP